MFWVFERFWWMFLSGGGGVAFTSEKPLGGSYYQKCIFAETTDFFCKSFQNLPPVFGHFLIFWCKVARCFQKHLHFGPPVTLQRKSSQNLTPVSGHLWEEVKVCRITARWRCQSKLNCKISQKQGPEGEKIKGLNLVDLRLATTWNHSIASIGHKDTNQTYFLRLIFNWPSPLVGCGEVCGRSTIN